MEDRGLGNWQNQPFFASECPDPCWAIGGSGDDFLSVRAEGNSGNAGGMAAQDRQRFAGGQIPNPDGVVG
jgi:hypothetical protein